MRSKSAEKLLKHCVLSVRMIREYAMPACRFLFHRISSMKRMRNGLNEPRKDFIGTRVTTDEKSQETSQKPSKFPMALSTTFIVLSTIVVALF